MSTDSPSNLAQRPAASQRRARTTRVGVVSSTARQKTIAVTVSFQVKHPKYGKYVRRQTKLHAHDEKGAARKGDIVEIAETRPISKTKSWRLLRIITRAPQEKGARA
jgi:small subunit ribosomal protein S17